MGRGAGDGATEGDMGPTGSLRPMRPREVMLAQAMPAMPAMGDAQGGMGVDPWRPASPRAQVMSDAVMNMGLSPMPSTPMGAARPATMGAAPRTATAAGASRERGFVPLGQVADIHIANGPPMVRDENGLLAGYVYVDIDTSARDIGGYVDEAKAVVASATTRGELSLPAGTFLEWTGQYELLEQMSARMKIVVPITLLIIDRKSVV